MTRIAHVLVDNDSWILPYAVRIVDSALALGYRSHLYRNAAELPGGDIVYLIGCTSIVPIHVLNHYTHPLVVHESALPEGAGFAPVQWQILAGARVIPICLVRAAEQPDTGPVHLRDEFRLDGTELNDEWRSLQGEATVRICTRFLELGDVPEPELQRGPRTQYRRRTRRDSMLDPNRSLAEQFDLLRVVDNERYPPFFSYRGHTYELTIRKRLD